MAFKILTENSVDNTNIDGARAEHFNAGLRDGIVKGAFNEGAFFTAQTNDASNIIFDTCELRISGHRVIIDEIWTQPYRSIPTVAERRAVIAEIVVDDSSNVSFRIFDQLASVPLIKDNLFRTENGAGTYQVEIGRFTLTTLGTITDITRTIKTITGGSSGKNDHFVSGEMTTIMLDAGMDANVIPEDIYDANGDYVQTNMTWELPETAGTVVKVNNVEQENLDFTSDPQTQLNNKADRNNQSQSITANSVTVNSVTANTAVVTSLIMDGRNNLYGLGVPNTSSWSSDKTIATTDQIPPIDSELSSTSENPVQNKVIKNELLNFIPIGTILSYAGKTTPTGYLWCDGSTFDTTTYADLYSVLGTNTLPNLNGRFLEGTNTANDVGTTVSAGLPNIKGSLGEDSQRPVGGSQSNTDLSVSGAFTEIKRGNFGGFGNGNGYANGYSIYFNAHTSNSIYSDYVNTVQPNSYKVMYIIRAL